MKPLRPRALAVGAAFVAAAAVFAVFAASASAAPSPIQLSLEQPKGGTAYGATAKLTATLTAAGKPLAAKQVSLFRGETSVASAVTDSAGKATFALKALRNDSYDARFTPSGSDVALYEAGSSGAVAVSVRPAIAVKIGSTLHAGHKPVGVPRGLVKIRGRVSPFVAGTSVVVRVTRKRRLVRKVSRPVVKSGANGRFRLRLKLPRRGKYSIRAEETATADLSAGASRSKHLLVVRAYAASGSRGAAVRALQRRLNSLGYLNPATGQFGASTSRAVLAFRKVTGMARNSVANGAVFRRLAAGGGHFRIRFPKAGKHAEFDWSRQVLVLARGAHVVRIVHASSGKPSTPTVFGHFHFYSKVPGYNAKGMYYSTFFVGGYAVHGYAEVPAFAASHGCIRIPISSAISVYRWLALGTPMYVYR
jgi:hypothetical protein